MLTYTNHALDQFLDDLRDVGIPAHSIVRLGKKFSPSTKDLSIFEQRNIYRQSGQTYNMIQDQKAQSESYHDSLMQKITQFRSLRLTDAALLAYLEFSDDSEFFDAFQVPREDDGMTQIGKRGKIVDRYYLLKQWASGEDAGIFRQTIEQDYTAVWNMPMESRVSRQHQWFREMVEEYVAEIGNLVGKYNACQDRLGQLYREKTAYIIGQKRIVGCTTTGAAINTEELQKASPGIVLVEEAGEILESHILTAMTPNTKQLVLIGDHKQLRPKINNYALTVEQGGGYDLNMSMFERLVLAGVPHTTLNVQHRMRPEISSLVKELTYPEMKDAPKTKGRPQLRGVQNNVVFVSHQHLEVNIARVADRRDEGSTASKENEYEASMILKCVRYLAQQGYGTDNLVILTPYLGQLSRLLKTLSKENDPILNDIDSFELTRAGLMSTAAANVSKRKIRISSIGKEYPRPVLLMAGSLTMFSRLYLFTNLNR